MGGNNKDSDKQIEHLLNSIKWYPQGGEGKPIYALVPSLVSVTSMNSKLNVCFNICGVHFRHGYMSWFFDDDHLLKMSKTLLNRYLKDNNYFAKLYKQWQTAINQLYSLVDKVNTLDYSVLSNNEMLKLFNDIYKSLSNSWTYFILIDCFDPHGDEMLQGFINRAEINMPPADLRKLLVNTKNTFANEERIGFLEIASFLLKNKKDYDKINLMLTEHQNKFYWFQNNYGHIRYLTVNDFYKYLNDLIKENNLKKIDKELLELKESRNNVKKEKSRIIKKYDIPQDLLKICNLFADLAQYRDERKKMNLLGMTAMKYILYKISKRLNVDVGTLECLAPWEVKDIFKFSRPKLLEIRDRKENSFWIFRRKKEILYFQMDESQKWKDFLNKLIISEHNELKGLCASAGKSSGRIKVISRVNEFFKMQQGDIIVTQMTRPEFTPVLKKAAAIITDEGGLTCHAAIISRELKIPCIIGTKIATKILKDNMLVEVDADKGIIKIISQNGKNPETKRTLKNIIFDITGIFLTSDEPLSFEYYAKKFKKVPNEIKEVHARYKSDFESGMIPDKEFTKNFFNDLNKEIDKNYWKLKLSFKKPIPEAFELLNTLKKKFKAYYITNEGADYWKKIDNKFNISSNFDGNVRSYEAKTTKPSKKIFEFLVNKYNLNPAECIFIDDNKSNLAGAKELGMDVLHYKDIETLKKDFKRLDLNI